MNTQHDNWMDNIQKVLSSCLQLPNEIEQDENQVRRIRIVLDDKKMKAFICSLLAERDAQELAWLEQPWTTGGL